MGPTSRVIDYGAKALSAIASLVAPSDEEAVGEVVDRLVDPVGTFYRYSLPASLLHRRVERDAAGSRGGGQG